MRYFKVPKIRNRNYRWRDEFPARSASMAESRRERPQSEYRPASLASGTNRKYNHMDVSVIIVNYKTSQLLVPAIDSILDKTEDIVYEIIVVDNHSQDDSERVVHEHYGNRVTYLPLAENVGFGRANNEGLRIARGRNILFLNPDTILVNNAVRILSDYLDSHPDTGAVGGNLYTADMQPNVSFNRVRPSIFDETDQAMHRLLSRLRFGRNGLFNYTEHTIEVGFIVGADLMIPRQVLDSVGAFDPDFFMYYEETELCRRIAKAAYRIVSVPKAKIIHLEGKSFVNSADRERRALISRRIYFHKTCSQRYARIVDFNYQVLTKAAWLLYRIVGNKAKTEKFRQRKNLFDEINRVGPKP